MIGLIFVHGIGNKFNYPGWSKNIPKLLDKEIFTSTEYLWNDILQKKEDDILNHLFPMPKSPGAMVNYFARKTVFSYAMDATLYDQNRGELLIGLHEVNKKVSESVDKVILVGYSLGTWIAYDYLRQYNSSNIVAYISLACNIPLHFGIDLEDPKIPWVNYWENSDVLSMPLKQDFIEDIEYKSNSTVFGWNFSAHLSFMYDNKFSKIFKDKILELV